MAGTVIVPWYATGFRADAFEKELEPVAAAALRYGATSYAIYRCARRPLQVPAARRLRGAPAVGTNTGPALR